MIEKFIIGVMFIGSVTTGAYFLDDRHASADDLEKFKKQSAMSHTEIRLDYYEDKLMGLQLREKYQEQTQAQENYVTYEIVRVENTIEKLKRRIEND